MKRKKASKSKAVAYIRVSTDTERQELGTAGQRFALEQWALREGVEIVTWYTEEVSGGAPLDERPILLEAVASLKAEGAGLLAFSTLDRFSRDPLAAALVEDDLKRAGAQLVFADGSGNGNDPTAEMVRLIRLAVARFERRMIQARIRSALAVKQRRGEMTGAAPYGCRAVPGPTRTRKDGSTWQVPILEKDPAEASVIALARSLAPGRSVRAVTALLASEGILGRKGKPLTRDAVWRLLKIDRPTLSFPETRRIILQLGRRKEERG